MKQFNRSKTLVLTTLIASLVFGAVKVSGADPLPVNAADFRAYVGNTFAVIPTADPTILNHPVDGVAQVSVLGNCHFHGESQIHLPTTAGQPIVILSTSPWSFVADNGTNSILFNAQGTAVFDPVNPTFANLTYTFTIVGGTGAFVGARGTATMSVTAQFTSQSAGLATWTMKGYVLTPPTGN